jgi:hypothetical protein
MAIAASILSGVIAYELHKRESHGTAIIFDAFAILLIIISWR